MRVDHLDDDEELGERFSMSLDCFRLGAALFAGREDPRLGPPSLRLCCRHQQALRPDGRSRRPPKSSAPLPEQPLLNVCSPYILPFY